MAGKVQSAPGVPSNGGIPMQTTLPSSHPSAPKPVARPVLVPKSISLPSGPTGAVTSPAIVPTAAQVSALVQASNEQATE